MTGLIYELNRAIENRNAEINNRRRWQEQREIRELAALEEMARTVPRPHREGGS